MRRTALLVLCSLVVATVAAVGAGARPAAAEIPADVAGDFNNDGIADLAIGAPGENGVAGAVNVLYGGGGGLSGTGAQVFFQVGGRQEAGDRFGAALAAGDFNGDGIDDLAAGATGENVGNAPDAGAVSVVYGSGGGLTTAGAQLFFQVGSAVEGSDLFGFALAAGDFDGDGFADLAVGAPTEAVGGVEFAGAVSVLYGSNAGLSTAQAQLFTQVGGAVESGDEFGAALAAGDFDGDGIDDLAAGAPGEGVGSAGAAGAVSVVPGSSGGLTAAGAQVLTQVGGSVEAGDRFGAALAAGNFDGDGFTDLAAGAPMENVGGTVEAGAVSAVYGSGGGLTSAGGQLFTQIAGLVETLDLFGFSLAVGDFDQDGFADLAAGAPFEDVGEANAAGAVSAVYGSGGGLTTAGGQLFTQVAGMVEAGDQFGAQVASGDFNGNGFADLAAAAPTEDVGAASQAGAVSVLPGAGGGLTTAGSRLLTQDSPGVPGTAETFDLFGGLQVAL